MHLELTPEALLAQLGYTKTEQTLNQILSEMDGFEATDMIRNFIAGTDVP